MLRLKSKDAYFSHQVELNFRTPKYMMNSTDTNVVKYMEKYPHLKPIFFLIKTFLYNMGLTGNPHGLSSYSIMLMIVALFQSMEHDKEDVS